MNPDSSQRKQQATNKLLAIYKTFCDNDTPIGWCVKLGNSIDVLPLVKELDWQGILIEGDRTKVKELVLQYIKNRNIHIVEKLIRSTGPNCLDNVLTCTHIPQEFDILVIDANGNDWHVWRSLTKYFPRVVMIKYTPTFPSHICYVQPDDPNYF